MKELGAVSADLNLYSEDADSPHMLDGMWIDRCRSLPWAAGARPAAIVAAAPPLDLLADPDKSQGVRVTPRSRFSV